MICSLRPTCLLRLAASLGLLGLMPMVGGCGTYQLRGLVRETSAGQPVVVVVDQDDPRLDQSGLADARVQATLDPDKKAIDAGATITNGRGDFALPIKHGAGFLMYNVYVAVTRRGYKHAERIMPLPGSGERLLILLPPGEDNFKGRQNVLDQTLEMGKPYMDDGP